VTLQIDPGTVVAVCTAIGVIGGALGWTAKHYIRDVVVNVDAAVEPSNRPIGPGGNIDRQLRDLQGALATLSENVSARLTMADLIAALAKHEVSMIDRFNGRYPSKEVFLQAMQTMKDELAEVRKYIGDVRRDLAERLTREGDRLDEHMGDFERLLRTSDRNEG
jgi:hypothetical protein